MEHCTRCRKPIIADADIDAYMLGQMCADCLAEPEPKQKKKRKTHTSAAVKNRWNNANYDKITVCVAKGLKAEIKKKAEKEKMSVNALLTECLFKCYPDLDEINDHLNNNYILF